MSVSGEQSNGVQADDSIMFDDEGEGTFFDNLSEVESQILEGSYQEGGSFHVPFTGFAELSLSEIDSFGSLRGLEDPVQVKIRKMTPSVLWPMNHGPNVGRPGISLYDLGEGNGWQWGVTDSQYAAMVWTEGSRVSEGDQFGEAANPAQFSQVYSVDLSLAPEYVLESRPASNLDQKDAALEAYLGFGELTDEQIRQKKIINYREYYFQKRYDIKDVALLKKNNKVFEGYRWPQDLDPPQLQQSLIDRSYGEELFLSIARTKEEDALKYEGLHFVEPHTGANFNVLPRDIVSPELSNTSWVNEASIVQFYEPSIVKSSVSGRGVADRSSYFGDSSDMEESIIAFSDDPFEVSSDVSSIFSDDSFESDRGSTDSWASWVGRYQSEISGAQIHQMPPEIPPLMNLSAIGRYESDVEKDLLSPRYSGTNDSYRSDFVSYTSSQHGVGTNYNSPLKPSQGSIIVEETRVVRGGLPLYDAGQGSLISAQSQQPNLVSTHMNIGYVPNQGPVQQIADAGRLAEYLGAKAPWYVRAWTWLST
ncbi:MAG: hypothetical protein KF874_02735 [Rhizobiaceae bacterium]|nr:hypothetical protein [Rhizobiaceae bacterium]